MACASPCNRSNCQSKHCIHNPQHNTMNLNSYKPQWWYNEWYACLECGRVQVTGDLLAWNQDIICQSGATCLPVDCCFSEIALENSDLIINSSKCNLYSPWYSWNFGILMFNNNDSLNLGLTDSRLVYRHYHVNLLTDRAGI